MIISERAEKQLANYAQPDARLKGIRKLSIATLELRALNNFSIHKFLVHIK